MTLNFLDLSFNSWLEQHSNVAWFLQHPWLSLGLLFISLVLLFRLFAALAQLLDNLWIWILRSPVLLFKSLFRIGKKESDPPAMVENQINPTSTFESETLSQVLNKLEKIEEQQTQILQAISALKKQSLPKN